MDPVTQGALGSMASQNIFRRGNLWIAGVLGFLSGMAPDLDIFIRSDTDPLLALEYHRQFTHSLAFIPVGGLACALVFYLLLGRRWQLSFKQVYITCTAGYATHALLDACTFYGTQLFWPFSHARVSWNTISIIDPIFTFPLLGLIFLAAIRKNIRYARFAAAWVFLYLSFGMVQRERVEAVGRELAASRDHDPVRLEVQPSFGNQVLWRLVYEAGDAFHADGIRAGLSTRIYPGESIPKLDVFAAYPWLDPDSQQARDVERFRWFADDWIAVHPRHPNRIMDIRNSMLPNKIRGLWMIELDPSAALDSHVGYAHEHDNEEGTFDRFLEMVRGL